MRTLVSTILTALLGAILAGCAAGGPAGTPSPSDVGPTISLPTIPPPNASPTLHVDRPPNDEMTMTGIFGFDDIEGGCAYLQTDAKTRYEVLYPSGWKVDGNQLRDPSGNVAAQPGDSVTVRGGIATDMASTCQIGRVFRADEVVTIDR